MHPPVLTELAAEPTDLSFDYCSQGPYGTIWEFSAPAAKGSITLHESDDRVVLDTIDIEPQGTGLGTAIVTSLRLYVDRRGKTLAIPAAMNLRFFARFDWLDWSEPEAEGKSWSAIYRGAASKPR